MFLYPVKRLKTNGQLHKLSMVKNVTNSLEEDKYFSLVHLWQFYFQCGQDAMILNVGFEYNTCHIAIIGKVHVPFYKHICACKQ